MNDLILFVTWFGNISGWLFAARFLYRRWRPDGDAPLSDRGDNLPVGLVVFLAMITALIWPLVAAAMLVVARQPLTARERETRAKLAEKAAKAKIRELEEAERELAVATDKMRNATGYTVTTPPNPPAVSKKNANGRHEWTDPLSKRTWHD